MSARAFSRHWVGSLAFLVVSSLVSQLAWAQQAMTCYNDQPNHECLNTEDPIAACGDFLNTDPYNSSVRFSLCQAHISNGSSLKALIVLDQGLQLCGSDQHSCQRLRSAITSLEQDSDQQPGSADFRTAQNANRDTCLSRKRIPVNQAIVACEEALVAFPKDAALHGSLGEKLLKGGQPARAVLAFRTALSLRPGDPNFLSWHDAAEDARQTLVERCLRHTQLDRCSRAILPGTKDEAQLHLKRGDLYLEAGNSNAALEALLRVQAIDPIDSQVADKLLTLIPSTNKIDSYLYLPRGQALLATGATAPALKDLKRADATQQNPATVQAALHRARQQRTIQVQQQCLDGQDVKACQRLLIASEADANVIEQHITSLQRKQADRVAAAKKAKAKATSETSVKTQIARADPPSSSIGSSSIESTLPGTKSTVDQATNKKPQPAPSQPMVLAQLSNRALTNGSTH